MLLQKQYIYYFHNLCFPQAFGSLWYLAESKAQAQLSWTLCFRDSPDCNVRRYPGDCVLNRHSTEERYTPKLHWVAGSFCSYRTETLS